HRSASFRHAAASLGARTSLNFFPLVRSDGYYLLAELAGIPNLRTDAWKWLGSSTARQRMRAGLPTGRRLAVAAYGLASAAFTTCVLTGSVALIVRAAAGGG